MIRKLINVPADTKHLPLEIGSIKGVEYIDPAIDEYVKKLKPKTGYAYYHTLACVASEYYGHNNNGDEYPESDLLQLQTDEEVKKFNPKNKKYPVPRWQTMLFAKVYYRHRYDESYGNINFAVWNPRMHWLECITAIKINDVPNEVWREALKNGEPVPFSIGCHVLYDECSICGNRRYNPNDKKCVHIAQHLGEFDEKAGKWVSMINHGINFFDLSIVVIPADNLAYSMRKVAEGFKGINDLYRIKRRSPETLRKVAEFKELLTKSRHYIYNDEERQYVTSLERWMRELEDL